MLFRSDISRGACPNGVNNTVCCGQTDFNWFTNFKGVTNGDLSHKMSEYGQCPCTTEGAHGQQNIQCKTSGNNWNQTTTCTWDDPVSPNFDNKTYGWNVRPGSPGGNGPYCMNYDSGYICLPAGYYFTKCQDDSAWYYLRVYNTGGPALTCGSYKLEFSNGVYGAPSGTQTKTFNYTGQEIGRAHV